MKFLVYRKSNQKLRISWVYRSGSPIWCLYPTGSDWIVGEERDPEQKKATFFSLNRMSGKVAWSKMVLADWWVGVEAVTRDLIFLHGFATPDMPIHKGITAVDVLTGELRWEKPDLSFERMGSSTIIGSRGAYGNKRYTAIDTKSGRVLEEWMDPDDSMSAGRESEPRSDRILFPETVFDAGADIPSFVQQFLKQHGQSGPFSWAEAGTSAVITYQVDHPVETASQTTRNIAVIRISDNAELFSDIISTAAGMFVPDSFLIQDGMLYYVRRKHDLVAVDLMRAPDGSKKERI